MITPFLASLFIAQGAAAPTPADSFSRMITRKDGTLEMQTAAQRLVADGKPIVWLVGAIHIGSKPYYGSLRRLLDYQDEVLYEGVKGGPPPSAPATPPASAIPPTATAPAKPVYKILSDAIGLEFQQTQITYDHPGWTNVDLSWSDLEKLNQAASSGKPSQFDQVKGLLDPTSPTAKMLASVMGMASPGMKEAIKIMMVKSAGGESAVGLDPATERIILKARNESVVTALDATFARTDAPRALAVLYGAKHMPDLQATLVAKYGYRLDEKRWFAAADADPKKVDAMGQALLDGMEKAMKQGLKKGP